MHEQLQVSPITTLYTPFSRQKKSVFFGGFQPVNLLILLVLIIAPFFPAMLCAVTREDSLFSQPPIESCILKELNSSKVLISKDIDRPVSPASLTKILTCVMAIESGKLEQDVVITQEATMVEPSKAGFKAGERIKLVDLVKAAMVNSSNDAAFAIAIHLSGSVDAFVASMNARAKALGMKNSHFTNPAGFDKGIYAGNSSTAGDLLALTEYAVRNPVFNSIAKLERAVFTEQSTRKVYSLKTHNKLLDKYPYAVGIKTGYTTRAGRCLIGRAVKDNRDILLVMLNAKTDRWTIAADMFDKALLVKGDTPLFARASVPALKHRVRSEVVTRHSGKRDRIVAKHGRRSLKSHVALVASAKKTRQHVAVASTVRKSSKHDRVVANSSRGMGKRVVAISKQGRKLERKSLATLKSGRKMKKRDLAVAKPLRKNKKRPELSFQSGSLQVVFLS
jgi:D-alanyl-D-alanine carboxypeptidase (penicillin-binding protein 5/6)